MVAFILAGLAACSTAPLTATFTPSPPTPSSTPQTLTVEMVSHIAMQEAGAAATGVEEVDFGQLKDFVDPASVPGIDANRTVWAVLLSGEWAGSCPPTVPRKPCPIAFRHAIVILDYFSGAFLAQLQKA